MKNSCKRCGRKMEEPCFIVYEVDQQGRKRKQKAFCIKCGTKLLDEMRGKVKWFARAHSP